MIYLVSPFLWLSYSLLLDFPLWLLGFPICAWLANGEEWTLETKPQWQPKWAWLWSNTNDGVIGPDWWYAEHRNWDVSKRAFVWSAWRNPVNNLRLVPFLHPVIDPKRIQWRGNSEDPAHTDPQRTAEDKANRPRFEWSFTWQGIYAGVVLRANWGGRHTQLRWGWKLLPQDARGVDPKDHRAERCPFGFQFHFWGKT